MGAGIQGGVIGDDYPDQIVFQNSGPRINALPVLTDYRKVLSDIMINRVGVNNMDVVFPTYTQDGVLGLSRA
jgi:alpha-glucuronidase